MTPPVSTESPALRMRTTLPDYARETRFGKQQSGDLPWVKVIPYDYQAKFEISGEVGRVVEDVINISVEGVFVAVAIGYAFEEDRTEALALSGDQTTKLGDLTLDRFPPDSLIDGIRISPRFRTVAVTDSQNGQIQLNRDLDFSVAKGIFERVRPAREFSFLLSIVDSATGRELQNRPVHSVAGLGRENGNRPFKALSQPLVFMPRSTIRLQIEQRTADVKGRLFITLQGYKVLGVAGNLEEAVRTLVETDPLRRLPVYDYGSGNYRTLGEAMQQHVPTTGVVPFDYVSTLTLEGKPDNIVEDEVPVNVDGGYMTLAIGYSLDVPASAVQINLVDEPDDETTQKPLASITLKEIQVDALLDGIRIHPLRSGFAFTSSGQLLNVQRAVLNGMFQRLNLANDVRFLYSIVDSGTGRELQNELVHNVAGLGIANGERPFRVLHKPMMFLPRSTIRVQVREISGRGRLYMAFQGYKILG